MLSHIVHKLAQVAVTLAPRIGTVYSGALCTSGVQNWLAWCAACRAWASVRR